MPVLTEFLRFFRAKLEVRSSATQEKAVCAESVSHESHVRYFLRFEFQFDSVPYSSQFLVLTVAILFFFSAGSTCILHDHNEVEK